MRMIRFLICLWLTWSLVASGGLLAKAQSSGLPAQPEKVPASQTAPAKTSPTGTATPGPSSGTPKAPASPPAAATQAITPKSKPQPVLMELRSSRDTYRATEDIWVKAELWALQPVTLCLYPEHPEANFSADIYRAGYGKLDLFPNVIRLAPQDLRKVDRVSLEPGQVHRVLFNLKKLAPMPAYFWKTGEYRVQVTFFMCGKSEGEEKAIHSQGPLYLLVLE